MSTRGLRLSVKRYARDPQRRKMVLDLDRENGSQAENSIRAGPQEVQASNQVGVLPPAIIDVEAIDDEVVISSPRRFAEARNKSRRNHGVTVVVDGDSEVHPGHSGIITEEPTTRLTLHSYNKRKRVPPNQTIINCELYINLEDNSNTSRKKAVKPLGPPQSVPPPKAPTFSCPVCMGTLVEEMSTKCGHIFCKKCIKTAIAVQSKCPTCRQKLTMKDTIRVYLPAAS